MKFQVSVNEICLCSLVIKRIELKFDDDRFSSYDEYFFWQFLKFHQKIAEARCYVWAERRRF